jgi:Universal stress protein UspA and related nucleotide-binding proteins
MYSRILVPLDGSRAAEEALPAAAAIARRTGAELELALVHVSVASALAAAPATVDFGELDRVQLEDEAVYLRRITERLNAAHDLRVSAHHLSGPVVDTLAAHIQGAHVDLVVMTTHGRGAVGRLWLGSVADGLVRTVATPVLDASRERPAGRASRRVPRILVPLDQSPVAEHAVLAARELLEDEGECLLVSVIDPSPLMKVAPLPFGLVPEVAVDNELQDTTRAYLERVARHVRRLGARARTSVRIAGNPAPEILSEAARERVDAIVVTSHGVGGFRRFLLGSVVDKLVRGAEVPVLVCRPPAEQRPTAAPRTMAIHRAS